MHELGGVRAEGVLMYTYHGFCLPKVCWQTSYFKDQSASSQPLFELSEHSRDKNNLRGVSILFIDKN